MRPRSWRGSSRTHARRWPRARGLRDDEPAAWTAAAESMYLPFDERLGVHPQDDGFLDKEVWDFENTPDDHYPLLLHYHPLNLYRSQVIKQADTLLAMFLMNGRFSAEEKKRNFDYYDPITTHDSSLSVCIQSIVAGEIGYWRQGLRLLPVRRGDGPLRHRRQREARGRISPRSAARGWRWPTASGAFATAGGTIAFRPWLPDDWTGLRFAPRGARPAHPRRRGPRDDDLPAGGGGADRDRPRRRVRVAEPGGAGGAAPDARARRGGARAPGPGASNPAVPGTAT